MLAFDEVNENLPTLCFKRKKEKEERRDQYPLMGPIKGASRDQKPHPP